MLDSFDVPPPVPVRVLDGEAYDTLLALTDEDRAWLDRMAEGLPRSMPVDGSSWWLLVAPDPHLFSRSYR